MQTNLVGGDSGSYPFFYFLSTQLPFSIVFHTVPILFAVFSSYNMPKGKTSNLPNSIEFYR